jgi:hypothetical protein
MKNYKFRYLWALALMLGCNKESTSPLQCGCDVPFEPTIAQQTFRYVGYRDSPGEGKRPLFKGVDIYADFWVCDSTKIKGKNLVISDLNNFTNAVKYKLTYKVGKGCDYGKYVTYTFNTGFIDIISIEPIP